VEAIAVCCHPSFLLNGTLLIAANRFATFPYQGRSWRHTTREKAHDIQRIVAIACRCYANAATSAAISSGEVENEEKKAKTKSENNKTASDAAARLVELVEYLLASSGFQEEQMWAVYYGMKIGRLLPTKKETEKPPEGKHTYFLDSPREIEEDYYSSRVFIEAEREAQYQSSDTDMSTSTIPNEDDDDKKVEKWRLKLLEKVAAAIFTRNIQQRNVHWGKPRSNPGLVTVDTQRWYTNEYLRLKFLLDDLKGRKCKQIRPLIEDIILYKRQKSTPGQDGSFQLLMDFLGTITFLVFSHFLTGAFPRKKECSSELQISEVSTHL